ncbi:hypothetical protein [Candidatus Poriferisodalis sp.]|uniref:hypothetical protein n=1 Tax=Candidatus Poriferisodalis sp. TaxID=3101277 RepID=UPI003B02334C
MPAREDMKNLTLRIDRTLADQARAVAEITGSTVSDVIRNALAEHVERRRKDPEFQMLLRRNLERHQELLNMLADS